MKTMYKEQAVFTDKYGAEIKCGDLLLYSETGENSQVHEVIEKGGELHARVIVDYTGEPVVDERPCELRYYQRCSANDGVCFDVEIKK
jgi:hypothetical protein